MNLPDAYIDEFIEPPGYMNFASIGPVSNRVRATVDGLLGEIGAAQGAIADNILPRYEQAGATIAGEYITGPDGASKCARYSTAVG